MNNDFNNNMNNNFNNQQPMNNMNSQPMNNQQVNPVTQGFQQLQTSYNVPNTVQLSTVAHLPAYRKLVEDNLDNLRKEVPTRAIYQNMMVRNGISVVRATALFDTGGWGI